MSMTKVDREEFLLIKYYKEFAAEISSLRDELTAEAQRGGTRDVILEFTNASAIYSMEIGVIVQFLRMITPKRVMRFVASNYVCEMLITMNVHKIPNITMYNSLDELHSLYPDVEFDKLA